MGQEAKSFLGSKLYLALSQHLSEELGKEYPKPNKRGWEEQYRYARAYEHAAADVVKYLVSLKDQLEYLNEKERDQTSIEDA